MKEEMMSTAQPTGLSPALRAQEQELDFLIFYEVAEIYKTAAERAAYRAGMSSSAAICDAVARSAIKSRREVKREILCRDIAKRCGDEIMRIREYVRVPRRELDEPRGLSASELPLRSEAVINNPVDPTPGERGAAE